jgi:exopolysaccharide production protein ExoZ
MVVWHHALSQIAGTTDFFRIPDFGPSGVDVFFVISGFIMVVTTAGKPITGSRFFLLRIVRVVPLYWIATLTMIVIAILAPNAFKTLRFDGISIVKSLLFIPYDSLAAPGHVWPLLVPGWTLNFEMFFYALFALSLCMPKWRLQAMLGVLSTLVIAGYIFPRTGPLSVYTNPLMLEFGAGVWLGHEWLKGKLSRGLAVSVTMMTVGGYLLAQVESRPSLIVGATLVVMGALNQKFRASNNRLLLELGNASYSIYLTHLFTLGALRVPWMRFIPNMSQGSAIAFMSLALLGSFLVGWLCYRLIERPMTAWLQAIAHGPPQQSAPISI